MEKEQKKEEIYRLQLLYLFQQAQNQVQHENQNPNADFQHDGHPDDKIQKKSSFFFEMSSPEAERKLPGLQDFYRKNFPDKACKSRQFSNLVWMKQANDDTNMQSYKKAIKSN